MRLHREKIRRAKALLELRVKTTAIKDNIKCFLQTYQPSKEGQGESPSFTGCRRKHCDKYSDLEPRKRSPLLAGLVILDNSLVDFSLQEASGHSVLGQERMALNLD